MRFNTLFRGPARKATFVAFAVVGLASTLSCRSALPNQMPVGKAFPAVSGEALTGEEVTLPPEEPCVLLVGYKQNAQFDADRWLMGILQAELSVPVYEVPTLKGLFPRAIGGWIDNGMRSGIPPEDWQSVVTLYGKNAKAVAEFTGTEGGRNMRVLLLDTAGDVIWFHDEGYSAREMLDLKVAAQSLTSNP